MTATNLFQYILPDINIYENKNIYIYFDKKPLALRQIMFMLDFFYESKCKVCGLAGENREDVGIRVFNKKVVHYSEMSKEKDVVVKWGGGKLCVNELDKPFFDDTALKKKQLVVWGTGAYAIDFCKMAEEYGWKVSFFIDSDIDKKGRLFREKEVYQPEKLKELPDESIIVEASRQWEEMDEIAKTLCPNTERLYFQKLSVLDVKVDLRRVYETYALIGDDPICIYGDEERVNEWGALYNYFDFHIEKQYCYGAENRLDQQTLEGIIALIQEGKYVLLTWERNIETIEWLEKAGVKYCTDFGFADPFEIFRYATREFIYDINLGFSYQKECKYPGIAVYGNEESAKYRIVCLGNSTTDAWFLPNKSWPEFLKQMAGDDVCVYNAGCESYNTVQDLIKLMRDMLEFAPDIVIEVSGVNETWFDEKYPFSFCYIKDVYRQKTNENIYKGIQHASPYWKQWLDNIEIMNAICKLHDIEYFAFLQPMLAGKPNKDIDEESRVLSWYNIIRPTRIERQSEFGNIIDQIKKDDPNKYSYIHNMTYIFDKVHHVYIDDCHLNDRGNYILAENIWRHMNLAGNQ